MRRCRSRFCAGAGSAPLEPPRATRSLRRARSSSGAHRRKGAGAAQHGLCEGSTHAAGRDRVGSARGDVGGMPAGESGGIWRSHCNPTPAPTSALASPADSQENRYPDSKPDEYTLRDQQRQ